MEDKGVEELKSQIEWVEEDLRQLKAELSFYVKPKLYKHYKNKKYYVITGSCMIQINNEWEDAILYRWEGGEKLFARSTKEFFEKFKLEV